MAKISPGFSAMAGAGASIGFKIIYKNGKFGIICHASASWGLGCRGKIAFEVNVPEIINFIYWFFHQLRASNYEIREFIEKEAFEAVTNIVFLGIQSGLELGERAGEKLGAFMFESATRIKLVVEAVSLQLEKSNQRNILAHRVLSSRNMLRFTTPEAKGMLLYQLTRHGNADNVDKGNFGWTNRDVSSDRYILLPDRYPERKQAVIAVLKWVQTRNEWKNVCLRVTMDGSKGRGTYRGQLIAFLELGLNMTDELYAMEKRLKDEPPFGKVYANDSPQYAMS